jgi:hypothetical protein
MRYVLLALFSLQLAGQQPNPAAGRSLLNRTLAGAASDASLAPVTPPVKSPVGLDLQSRKRDELSHLNSVIQYYLSTLAPIQTAGSSSDSQYRDEAIVDGKQVAELAFQSARAEATFETLFETGASNQDAVGEEEQRLRAGIARVNEQAVKLTTQRMSLQEELESAKHDQLKLLREQIVQVNDAINLDGEMNEALAKILANSNLLGHVGLAGDIDRLQRTTPELIDGKTAPIAPPLDSLSGVASAGLNSQLSTLFQLHGARSAIENLVDQTKVIEHQANDLEAPLTVIVQKMMKFDPSNLNEGESAGQTSAFGPALSKEGFEATSATLKALSATAMPLTQEIISLEQSRANLLAWSHAVDTEYKAVVRSLTLRFVGIAVVLALLLILGQVWKRLTVRWVHDVRRRRQLMGPRRIVIGCLCAVVVFFGCVTQFHSLATVAGFIVAGLAVGLQTILLSVAAYFFIIGRYGVQVGDRMTVTGVTGDVVEVDLLRFYLMELAGDGDELAPTGRVAVFNNAVLFQAGTPLYKQMPGIEYTWHEMTLSMHPTSSCEQVSKTILAMVGTIYEQYRASVERQHMDVMGWADIRAGMPKVESRLQFAEGGLQLLVRFPVELDNATRVDEQVTQAMVHLMQADEGVKATLIAEPMIKASVRV